MKTEKSGSIRFIPFVKKGLKTDVLSELSLKQGILNGQGSYHPRDYRYPEWDIRSLSLAAAKSFLCVILLSYFFYRSIWAMIPLSAVGVAVFKKTGKEKSKADRRMLESQFGDAIRAVAVSLKSGYSVENAFIQSGRDMGRQYGENSLIFKELESIRRGLVINISLEDMLNDLGIRSGCEPIKDFAGVFSISKRCGGNMVNTIEASTDTISLMIETRQEIGTALSGRKMEQRVMKVMPFGILAYVGISSPGYFDPLYGNPMGILLMTGLLAVYIAAYVIGDRILESLEEG